MEMGNGLGPDAVGEGVVVEVEPAVLVADGPDLARTTVARDGGMERRHRTECARGAVGRALRAGALDDVPEFASSMTD